MLVKHLCAQQIAWAPWIYVMVHSVQKLYIIFIVTDQCMVYAVSLRTSLSDSHENSNCMHLLLCNSDH